MKSSIKTRPAKYVRLALLIAAFGASFWIDPAMAAGQQATHRLASYTQPATGAGQAFRSSDPDGQTENLRTERLQRWLSTHPDLPGGPELQIDIEVLPNARAPRTPPCAQTSYFLASGARLWGRVNVGERCTDAAQRWTAWHAAVVRIHGPALVSRQPVAAGSALQASDFDVETIEWTRHSQAPAPIDIELAHQQLQRSLTAGQPLRADHLRPLPAIRSGELIQAIAEGEGFKIAADATALSSGTEGQSIRVRTATGKVLTGTVSGKTVKISR